MQSFIQLLSTHLHMVKNPQEVEMPKIGHIFSNFNSLSWPLWAYHETPKCLAIIFVLWLTVHCSVLNQTWSAWLATTHWLRLDHWKPYPNMYHLTIHSQSPKINDHFLGSPPPVPYIVIGHMHSSGAIISYIYLPCIALHCTRGVQTTFFHYLDHCIINSSLGKNNSWQQINFQSKETPISVRG